jgi:hypothetical protein
MSKFFLPVAFAGNYYVPAVGPMVANAPAVPYAGEYQRYEEVPYQFLAPSPQQAGSDWGSAAGMAALGAAIGLAGTMLAKAARPAPLATLATGGRAGPVTMAAVDGEKYDNVWGMDWKLA